MSGSDNKSELCPHRFSLVDGVCEYCGAINEYHRHIDPDYGAHPMNNPTETRKQKINRIQSNSDAYIEMYVNCIPEQADRAELLTIVADLTRELKMTEHQLHQWQEVGDGLTKKVDDLERENTELREIIRAIREWAGDIDPIGNGVQRWVEAICKKGIDDILKQERES